MARALLMRMPRGALGLLAAVPSLFPSAGAVVAQQTVTFKTVGSLHIEADLFRPASGGPHPVVLWIHGGALIFGDRGMLPAEQRDLYVRSGFAVFTIDYRLAPETRLDGILQDLDDAHSWIRSEGPRFGLDPARLAVVGHSAGGYLALASGVRLRPRPRAVVSFYGYGDIAGDWYARPDPFYGRDPEVSRAEAYRAVGDTPVARGDEARRFTFYRYCRQRGLWPELVAGHDPQREPGAFDALCPVRGVTRDYPPTLLLHGDQDRDVPYARSVEMAAALARESVPHELVTLPGHGHVFDIEGAGMKDPLVARAFERVVAFLSEHLGR